jgi:small subunit ribosomal protein S16
VIVNKKNLKIICNEGDRSMVRIRLRRVGAPKQPSYRVVAANRESPRDGKFLEILGHYNPRTQPETIHLKEDRVYYWLSVGAQPSDAVAQLFKTMGTMERFERFKAGEEVEKLVEEAAEFEASRNVSPKTQHETPVSKKKKAAEEESEE